MQNLISSKLNNNPPALSAKTIILCSVFLLIFLSFGKAQENPTPEVEYKPLKINLNEDGSQYVRFIMWHQVWLSSNNLSDGDANIQLSTSLRRSRFLAYGRVSPKFLILTHFGLNSLNTENLSSMGNGSSAPQFFLHGAWAELKLSNALYLGAGLHYWNGITRFASHSTMSFVTLDQSRPFNAWHSLGITDQYGRHLGVYLKGSSGKLEYRFAWNTPGHSPLDNGKDYSELFNLEGIPRSTLTYTGISVSGSSGQASGHSVYTGYVKYNFWDEESVELPYYAGTYLGKKKVFAIGAGFFVHPDGMYDTEYKSQSSVMHYAMDAFLDYPVAKGVVNAYVAIQKFDYGEDYISRWGGTGMAYFGQAGYYLSAHHVMPYIAYSVSDYEGAEDLIKALDIGINYFMMGHNCKVTAEYHSITNDFRESSMSFGGQDRFSQIRIQLQVFI